MFLIAQLGILVCMSKQDDFDFYCDVALKPDAEIEKVFENEKILAFYHTKPFWETHIVVIPKEHVWDVRHVEDTTLFSELFAVCRDILKTFPQEELDKKGAKILSNVGTFQDTPHLHFHIAIGGKI